MKKLIKEKKKKSYYGRIITPLLLTFFPFCALCLVGMIVYVYIIPEQENLVVNIILTALLLFCIVFSLVIIFLIVPRLRKKQARLDYARCDFTPYISEGESEIFTCEYHMCRYTMDASPFDEDTSLNFKNDSQAREYVSQHFAQTLTNTYLFENGTEKSPFFISYYSEGEDGISVRIDKKTDGKTTTLDIYEVHIAEFTEEGLNLGERVIPYHLLQAEILTAYKDYYTIVRVLIPIESAPEKYGSYTEKSMGYLSFEISSRIAEVIKRFNIKVSNKPVLDYVLNDPLKAFEQTALQVGLKKLK